MTVFREATPERTLLFCPRCSDLLAGVDFGVEQCPRCEGLWIGNSVLDLGRGWPAGPQAWWRNELRCPDCESIGMPSVMTARESAGVIVDQCSAHGVWLDRGELARVMRDPVVKDLEKLRAAFTSLEPTREQLAERRAHWKATQDDRAQLAAGERKRLATELEKREQAAEEERAAREARAAKAMEEARARDAAQSEAQREALARAAKEARELEEKHKAARDQWVEEDSIARTLALLKQTRDSAKERVDWLTARIENLEYELMTARQTIVGARHALDEAEHKLLEYSRGDVR